MHDMSNIEQWTIYADPDALPGKACARVAGRVPLEGPVGVVRADLHAEVTAEVERLSANLAAIRLEIDARRECADMKNIRAYAAKDADMRPATLMQRRRVNHEAMRTPPPWGR